VTEDDAGILWKHAPNRYSPKGNIVVRSHRLNIMTAANFGNYDYIVTWSFHQDASISLKTQLTGIVSTNMLAVNATPAGYGAIVAPQVLF
jgi:primary-amine oxidase